MEFFIEGRDFWVGVKKMLLQPELSGRFVMEPDWTVRLDQDGDSELAGNIRCWGAWDGQVKKHFPPELFAVRVDQNPKRPGLDLYLPDSQTPYTKLDYSQLRFITSSRKALVSDQGWILPEGVSSFDEINVREVSPNHVKEPRLMAQVGPSFVRQGVSVYSVVKRLGSRTVNDLLVENNDRLLARTLQAWDPK